MDLCIAENRQRLGMHCNKNLQNEMVKRKINKQVATIITQTLVDKDDPAIHIHQNRLGAS